jgi:hypothetical protein
VSIVLALSFVVLTFFVEEDYPESHVEVEDGNEGKSIITAKVIYKFS